MDILNNILAISQPTGVWAKIITAFESGLGSYLLAIVIITLIVRILLSPFDTVNKRISKKQTEAQAKLQPEMEKLQKKYGHDRALLQQQQQALYKKAGIGMGGSCLFMLIFMAINLTVFFTLFSSLNGFADYKINQQYLSIKDSYSNSLNLVNEYISNNGTTLFTDYENLTIKQENNKVSLYNGENLIYEIDSKNDFTTYNKLTDQLNGDITTYIINYDAEKEFTEIKKDEITYFIKTDSITKNEEVYTLNTDTNLYSQTTSDQYIFDLVRTYISKEEVKDGETQKYTFQGDNVIIDNEGEENDVRLSQVIKSLVMPDVYETYEETKKENSFLWIGSIWVADSPFKSSIFTFDEYKKEIGEKNVSDQEEVIYNSFMNDLREEKGRVNGYFILAIISIGLSFLTAWLGQLTTNKKKNDAVNPLNPQMNQQTQKSNKIILFVMPAIMGLFAILYNSVFAIYLIVGQAISSALTPVNNVIIKALDKHEKKREEAKQPVVDYRRK